MMAQSAMLNGRELVEQKDSEQILALAVLSRVETWTMQIALGLIVVASRS